MNAKLSLSNSLWSKLRKDIGMITPNAQVYLKKGRWRGGGGGEAEEEKDDMEVFHLRLGTSTF